MQLGGPLIQDTTITSGGFDLTVTGDVNASKFATIGGTSSQFVKGDGSLDNTSYQTAGNYITSLTGDGTASGPGSAVFTLSPISAIYAGTWGSSTQVPLHYPVVRSYEHLQTQHNPTFSRIIQARDVFITRPLVLLDKPPTLVHCW